MKQELVLDETLLRSLPTVTIDVSFETGQGKKSGSVTGVLLWALIEKAGTVDTPGKNARPALSRPPARMRWGIVPVILAIVAAAVWLVPRTPADSPARWSAWGGVVVATVVAVWLYRRGSGVRIN